MSMSGSRTSPDILAALSPDLRLQIPNTVLCRSALEEAARVLPVAIFNHSLRVFLIAKWLGEKERSDWIDQESLSLLFVACVCHDFGASHHYDGEQRFEIEGADAAVQICHACTGVSADDAHKVWMAIALHSTPGIAERIDPFVRLVRLGVRIDFNQSVRERFGAVQVVDEMQQSLPRLAIEKVLGDAVVAQARNIPGHVDCKTWPESEKHPKASWPGILLRAHLENPGYEGVNPAF